MHCPFLIHESKTSLLTSSPPWKGEGSLPGGSSFPPSVRATSLILWADEGGRDPLHLKGELSLKMGLSLLSSSPMKERDNGCSSRSPIKPSIELGRSVISVSKRNFDKEVFKTFYKGYFVDLFNLSH